MWKKGQIAWNKKEVIKFCKTCKKQIIRKKSYQIIKLTYCCSKCAWADNEYRQRQQKSMKQKVYDNEEIKLKISEDMKQQYIDGRRDRYKTNEAAHNKIRELAKERLKEGIFKTYISKRGYVIIYIPLRGNVKYHHWVWEQAGNTIPEGYVLHHKDYNKLNNELNNLKLLKKEEHHKLHYSNMKIDTKTGRFLR